MNGLPFLGARGEILFLRTKKSLSNCPRPFDIPPFFCFSLFPPEGLRCNFEGLFLVCHLRIRKAVTLQTFLSPDLFGSSPSGVSPLFFPELISL